MTSSEPAVNMIMEDIPKNENTEWCVTLGLNGDIASAGNCDARFAI
jgi:hypothetical protein